MTHNSLPCRPKVRTETRGARSRGARGPGSLERRFGIVVLSLVVVWRGSLAWAALAFEHDATARAGDLVPHQLARCEEGSVEAVPWPSRSKLDTWRARRSKIAISIRSLGRGGQC